jgi:DUF1009 family protein
MDDKSSSRIGLIAGEGEFPLILAKSLKSKGYSVYAVCFSKEQEKNLKELSERVTRIYIGQLGKLIETFKKDGVRDLVFLGKVDKSHALRFNLPDFRALKLWRSLRSREDNSLLTALVEELESSGFVVRSPAEFLSDYLTPEGVLTKREPSTEEWEDIRYGLKVAKAIGDLDIGQCVVVKNRMTVAVEAMEGTDETILRGGRLVSGAIVVKIAKPRQDPRLDLPVVGYKTIETMIKAKAKVLALLAGKTFFLQREKALELANKHGIAICGVKDGEGEA